MLATRMRMSTRQRMYTYKINQSCRFNDNDSAYLHWTPAGTGTEETFTFSTWVKRCNLGSIMQIFNAAAGNEIQFTAADKLQFTTATATLLSTQVFRDVGSHLHVVLGVDTKQATAANRVSIEINGVAISDFDIETYPNLNEVTEFGKASIHHISSNEGGTEEFDGYQSEVIYIDGLKVAASNFGKSKYGIWIPKRYTGSYGTNGFKLDFADSSDLGNDVSGNNNDFTSSGLASNDQVEDSPTNNYPTLNTIANLNNISNGNLDLDTINSYYYITAATKAIPLTGKWYWEVTDKGGVNLMPGIINIFYNFRADDRIAENAVAYGYSYYRQDGNLYYGAGSSKAFGATYTTNDIIGIAVNMDDEEITFYKNNVLQGTEPITISVVYPQYVAAAGDASGSFNTQCSFNFGQLGFAHTPPTGYKALCSNNIPTPSVKDSSIGFDTILYEGNATVRDITDLNFDISAGGLVWIKNRDAVDEHKLIDTVRGATKELSSDSTVVEGTDVNGLTAFLSNGFSLGTGANGYNDNAESFVAWCFRMGSRYGFDIQTYTGTGVAHAENHNLGGTPELMEIKNLSVARSWIVYHYHALNKTDPETDYGVLDEAAAWLDNVGMWNDTAPTPTQFTIGTGLGVNESGEIFVAYLWRSIEGFSKVGSFEGNGNIDGPFVYCGFRPAYIMIKSIDSSSDWHLYDSQREGYNVDNDRLIANDTTVEGTVDEIDILSNGFKLRIATDPNVAETYAYIAYAEQPGKWSNAR